MDEEKFKALWMSDKSVSEVAKELEISVSQVGNIKRKLSLPNKKSGPRIAKEDLIYPHTKESAYLMGVAIGDGNISKMKNGVYRLRLYSDAKYPQLIERWKNSCELVFRRKASVFTSHMTNNCKIIVVYSNMVKNFPWKPNEGHKWKQKVKIPDWILEDESFLCSCIKGLFESDGCFYTQRVKVKQKVYSYQRAEFSNSSEELVDQVLNFLEKHNIPFVVVERNPDGVSKFKTTNYAITVNDIDKFCELTGFEKKT
jgi:hypothetical protein